jgi:hypothetical protein
MILSKPLLLRAERSAFPGFAFTGKRLTVSEQSLTRCKNELRRLTWRSVAMEYRYRKIRTLMYKGG